MYFYRKIDYPQRKRIRLRDHDYGSDGFYSITICTKNMTEYFGEIKNGIMGLNELGLIAHEYWKDIPKHFENVILDEFVIMPDHMHGILILDDEKNDYSHSRSSKNPDPYFSSISPKPKSIPTIIRSYKSAVTRKIHEDYPEANFYWHRSYHDRIIRNETELFHKRNYIRNNPRKWQKE